jgi:N-acetylglucosamine kinase-like BadF-type ATPase
VVGIDVGGSGARLVAAVDDVSSPSGGLTGGLTVRTPVVTARPPAADGGDRLDVVIELARRFRRAHPGVDVVAAAVGVAGLVSLVTDPGALHQVLRAELVAERTAVAADALTAHLGALGGRPGAVVAAGTGAIALGTDLDRRWHRVDGWGHLVGDLGSGAWIGAAGLRAALAAHDGRPTGASPTLLATAVEALGPVRGWPAALHPRPDRAGVLASFTPAVVDAARADDPVAVRILAEAGAHLGETLAAALVPGVPPLAAATGGVLGAGDALTGALSARLRELRPDAEIVPAAGSPLDGALILARSLVTTPVVAPHAPWLTVRPSTAEDRSPAGRALPPSDLEAHHGR